MAIQTHCLLVLRPTKLHISSASACNRSSLTRPPSRSRWLDIEIIRQCFIEFGDEGKQPAEADLHDAADAAQREAFKQQLPDLLTFTFSDPLGVSDELTTAFFTPMILFSVVRMTILLDVR